MSRPRRLLVVEAEVHYAFEGRLYAYGPYAREIDVWAELFPQVIIAAPLRHERPPGHCLPFARQNISMRPQWLTGGNTAYARLLQLAVVPAHLVRLALAMRDVDAIHVRCPGNLPLLGALLAPLFSRRVVGKYTSQWNAGPDEPFTWRVQRRLLASGWLRGPVTVYGRSPNERDHVVSFFTTVLDATHAARAQAAAMAPREPGPLRVLYVGRLTENKNVDVVLRAVGTLTADAVPVRCTIVGEGPERPRLETLCTRLGIGGVVEFLGGVPFERVLECYERADVLTLVSNSEGWGKALTEGMAFGLVCVASNTGVMPELLADGRGIVVPPRDSDALAAALRAVATAPDASAPMRARAATWAQQFTLDGLRVALGTMLDERWGLAADESVRHAPVEAFA